MGEDVESVMGGVRMGVNVDIKRTDGEYRNIVRHKHRDKCIAPVVLVSGIALHRDRKQSHCVVGFTLCLSQKKVEGKLKVFN